MLQIPAEQVRPQLRALFDPGLPASLRCLAVLDGHAAGKILTDDPARPTWGGVQEACFRSIYLGGALEAPILHQLVSELRQDGDVLIGLWPDDERLDLLPPSPDYEGVTLEFTDRPSGAGLADYLRQVPEGCAVRRLDRQLFERCLERDINVAIFGSAEKALEEGFGLCLMRGEEILSEAFAGPAAMGIIELGTATSKRYRGRGYATIICAHLIQACEDLGYQTYWNCAQQNLASVAVARKLGYRKEKEYRLLAWFPTVRS